MKKQTKKQSNVVMFPHETANRAFKKELMPLLDDESIEMVSTSNLKPVTHIFYEADGSVRAYLIVLKNNLV